MCDSVIEENIYFFNVIPDEFKTQEMCEIAVETEPALFFKDVPNYFVTRKMYELCKYAIAKEEEPQERRAKRNRV